MAGTLRRVMLVVGVAVGVAGIGDGPLGSARMTMVVRAGLLDLGAQRDG